MGILDGTTDHAIAAFDEVMKNRLAQIDIMLDGKITAIKDLVDGIRVTVSIDIPEVKKAEPA